MHRYTISRHRELSLHSRSQSLESCLVGGRKSMGCVFVKNTTQAKLSRYVYKALLSQILFDIASEGIFNTHNGRNGLG